MLYALPIGRQDMVEAKPLMGCERVSLEARAGQPRVDPFSTALCAWGGHVDWGSELPV